MITIFKPAAATKLNILKNNTFFHKDLHLVMKELMQIDRECVSVIPASNKWMNEWMNLTNLVNI